MGQEREEEVLRLEQMHRCLQAFHRRHIGAGRRRDHARAHTDKSHIDHAANADAGHYRQDVPDRWMHIILRFAAIYPFAQVEENFPQLIASEI